MIELLRFPRPGKAGRNEQRKALAAACNAVAVAIFVYAILQPMMAGHAGIWGVLRAFGVFLVVQGVLHYILAQVED